MALVVMVGVGVLATHLTPWDSVTPPQGVRSDSAAPVRQSQPAAAPTSTPVGDYFRVLGAAQRSYTPRTPGVVEYCPVDALGRAVCAFGELTTTQRKAVEDRGRQPLTVAPAGWDHNRTVTIPAASDVAGSTAYRGWFWNRSHLVADSLGGAATAENLITDTRTQNVGSTKVNGEYAGGMAAVEIQARRYLDTQDADACPLYYAATPQYAGDELIPRTVIVDLQSCDRTIDERAEISNTEAGWAIDYAVGTFTPAP